jgi:hypothetical protein
MQDQFYLQAMRWLYQFGISVERARQLFIKGAYLLQKHVKKEYV